MFGSILHELYKRKILLASDTQTTEDKALQIIEELTSDKRVDTLAAITMVESLVSSMRVPHGSNK